MGLTPDETETLQAWVTSASISPGFIRQVVREHGHGSVGAAFLLDRQHEEYALEFLLRQYKGWHYRPRYPALTLVDNERPSSRRSVPH